MGLISFITGSDNRKHLKKLEAIALKVEDYEEEYKKLSDDQLKAKTEEFRRRYKENYETLDDLCPKRSQRCAKQVGACSACGISTFRYSAA